MIRFAYGCLALVFLAGFGGALHAALDSLTVLQQPLAAALIAGLALHRLRTWPAVLCAGVAALWLAAPSLQSPPAPGPGTYVLYQKNLSLGNARIGDVIADIRATDPDIVTLNEVSDENRAVLETLKDEYPYQLHCKRRQWIGLSILSRVPPGPEAPICSKRRAFAAQQIQGPSGTGWIVAVHYHWPWPYSQADGVAALQDAMPALAGSKIVAGDFNAMPWSHAVRATRRATGTRYIGPRRWTLNIRGLKLPVDHVLAPSGRVTRRAAIGSDHRALLAQVSFE